jgi:lipid II:glycine glycyltransferase (peptidoglycan interpeptide bridge formation enzyme)
MHKDCIQRKVRRAERDGLHYEAGNNAELLRKFYALLKITRRRHRLPPQPFAWFRNLADSMGDRLGVHVASKDEHPAASILTLRYRSTLTYKYGCSDPAFNSSGGTALLFWKAIEQAKSVGLSELDLGRTDADNEGLKTFKERLGGVHSRLTYYSTRSGATAAIPQWSKIPAVRALFACAPDPLLTSLGTLFYKHSG